MLHINMLKNCALLQNEWSVNLKRVNGIEIFGFSLCLSIADASELVDGEFHVLIDMG